MADSELEEVEGKMGIVPNLDSNLRKLRWSEAFVGRSKKGAEVRPPGS